MVGFRKEEIGPWRTLVRGSNPSLCRQVSFSYSTLSVIVELLLTHPIYSSPPFLAQGLSAEKWFLLNARTKDFKSSQVEDQRICTPLNLFIFPKKKKKSSILPDGKSIFSLYYTSVILSKRFSFSQFNKNRVHIIFQCK